MCLVVLFRVVYGSDRYLENRKLRRRKQQHVHFKLKAVAPYRDQLPHEIARNAPKPRLCIAGADAGHVAEQGRSQAVADPALPGNPFSVKCPHAQYQSPGVICQRFGYVAYAAGAVLAVGVRGHDPHRLRIVVADIGKGSLQRPSLAPVFPVPEQDTAAGAHESLRPLKDLPIGGPAPVIDQNDRLGRLPGGLRILGSLKSPGGLRGIAAPRLPGGPMTLGILKTPGGIRVSGILKTPGRPRSFQILQKSEQPLVRFIRRNNDRNKYLFPHNLTSSHSFRPGSGRATAACI